MPRKLVNGTELASSRARKRPRPCCQIIMIENTAAPVASGNQPPSNTLCIVAAKSVKSITRNKLVAPRQIQSGKPHP